uniref:Uncharacterized protein n=1 Tax=Candidatus Kentrum sp. SD TaxID=2126332 RepID=A0A450YE51_9GAMM|nr:MAG: hypothetical protein BECKSD772F_GA0070984_10346 [Candidatus Kentron sp. SD]VFK39840.1 MAG: hypothetical protein BECKSD772E_GA0070983_100461 [Candidatus Kentron sp. SD]
MKHINLLILPAAILLVGIFYGEYNKPPFNVTPMVKQSDPKIESEVVDLKDHLQKTKDDDELVIKNSSKNKKEMPANDFIAYMYESRLVLDNIDLIYERIKTETDPIILNELAMIFFDVFDGSNPTKEEYDNIIKKTMALIDDPKTRPYAIRHISQILDDSQMKDVFDYYSPVMTEEEKEMLANQYVNFRVINGNEPFNHETMTEIYNKKKAKGH